MKDPEKLKSYGFMKTKDENLTGTEPAGMPILLWGLFVLIGIIVLLVWLVKIDVSVIVSVSLKI